MAAAWRDIEARLGELGGDSPGRFNWSAIRCCWLVVQLGSCKKEDGKDVSVQLFAENRSSEWKLCILMAVLVSGRESQAGTQMRASWRLFEEVAVALAMVGS